MTRSLVMAQDRRTAVPAGSGRVRPAQLIWLRDGETSLFGSDTYELLAGVAEIGSLRQAALRLGVSYSKAWHLVHDAEQRLGVQLFERRIGGSCGGGSVLTVDGRELAARYGALLAAADRHLAQLFERYFGDLAFAAPPDDGGHELPRPCRPARRC